MNKFETAYHYLFAAFGYPLRKTHGMPASVIDKAAARLGVQIPASLRAYYAVAGHQKRFNRSCQRFLHPSQWSIDAGKLIFLEENQRVCWWAVSARAPPVQDPAIYQSANEETLEWNLEDRRCSRFIQVMLHYQAVADAMHYCASCEATVETVAVLDADWAFAGAVGQLQAFHRQNQVICLLPGEELGCMPNIMIFAGAKTRADLAEIEESLSISLERL